MIQFLPSVILLFPLLVDALLPTNDHSTSDPIGESVFDLMATVLIASVITIDVDRIKHEGNLLKRILDGVKILLLITRNYMEIWFFVRAYKDTKDMFFIAFLITTLLVGLPLIAIIINYKVPKKIKSVRKLPVKYAIGLPDLLTMTCRFINDLTFGFLATDFLLLTFGIKFYLLSTPKARKSHS